jgi:23S rRNA (adenine2503-C2)-methyltransferase
MVAEALTRPRNLLGLDRQEFNQLAIDFKQPRYRGVQLYQGLYRRHVRDFAALTDLDGCFRHQLARHYEIAYPAIVRRIVSRDESVRYLLRLEDGVTVEAVYMPWRIASRQDRSRTAPSARLLPGLSPSWEVPRVTLCISAQAGCAVDCKFCFTGLLGFRRNLTAGEILGQVLAVAEDQHLWAGKRASAAASAPWPTSPRLNVVFMGQGEPLLNFTAVMKAVRILADPEGCGLSPRRITVSTSGIVPRIRDLAAEPVRPKLAISLNASTEEQRARLMPITRKYSLKELIDVCRRYPLRPRERLTFEYVLLDGINDSEADAGRVADLLGNLPSRVNLIPYNAGEGLPYRPPPVERVLAFQRVLTQRRVPTFIRISRGQDIMAACGQLSLAEF